MTKNWLFRVVAGLAVAAIVGCGQSGTDQTSGGTGGGGENSNLTGSISIDGSSTVFPISQALAEMFMDENPGVKVTVNLSGTGAGFKKLIADEIDIAGASRPVEEGEFKSLKDKKIEFVEVPVAFDGLTVVVNPKNNWVDFLTVAELKKIWESGSTVKTWKDIRPTWPDRPIKLFGPGTDSGTFDYFTEAVCGKKGNSRADYTASEDDNQLVQGVAGEEFGLGYFGFAYYEQSMDKLKVVPIDGGKGAITPSKESIMDGSYQPLSRPLFLYVKRAALDRPEVSALLDFFFADPAKVVEAAKYIPFNPADYATIKGFVKEHSLGTRFMGAQSGNHISEALKVEPKN